MISVQTKHGVVQYSVKSGCRKCYGRGYVGIDKEGTKLGCRCLKRVTEPIKEKPVINAE